jgi:tetratricopeptide (TPR) repeat protein
MRKYFFIPIVLFVFCTNVLIAAASTGKIPITTSSEKARNYYKTGLDYSDKLRAFDSLEYFKKAIGEDPKMAIAYLNLALSAPSPKEFFDNLAKAETLASNASDGEQLWIEGVKAGASGAQAKQAAIFEKLVAAYPNDERTHFLLGGTYFALQNWDKAIDQYTKATRINPKFSPPYNLLGYSYRAVEKYAEAEKAFKTYIQLIPDDPNPYDSYAELLMRIGRFDESIAQYRKALSLDPHFVNSYLAIATNYNYKGEYEKARTELQNLLKVARNDGERRAAYFAMSVSHVSERNWAKAIAEQEKAYALAKKLNDPAAMSGDRFNIGTILLESGQADAAKENFDQAAKLIEESKLSEEVKQNNKRNYLFNLATVALAKNDLSTAKQLSDEFSKQAEAAKNQPQIWQSHQLRGRIAFAEKSYKVALTELNQANLQNPQNLYRIAQALEASGDHAKAKQMYKRVAEFNILNALNYAFVRNDAQAKLLKL